MPTNICYVCVDGDDLVRLFCIDIINSLTLMTGFMCVTDNPTDDYIGYTGLAAFYRYILST